VFKEPERADGLRLLTTRSGGRMMTPSGGQVSQAARLIVLPLAVALFFAACDPRTDDEAPQEGGIRVAASPEEIIQRVLEAGEPVTRVQIEADETSTQLDLPDFPLDGRPQKSHTLTIRVGEDYYTKNTSFFDPRPTEAECEQDPAICEEFDAPCDQEPESCSQLKELITEYLTYGGKWYYRDSPDQPWGDESGCGSAIVDETEWACSESYTDLALISMHEQDCPGLETLWPDQSLISTLYSLDFGSLTDFTDIERKVIDARELIHLRATYVRPIPSPFDLSAEMQQVYEKCGIPTPDPLPTDPFPFPDYFPERYEGDVELWIGREDYFVYRIREVSATYNGDRVLQTTERDSRYSLFNEAQLPGPRPPTAVLGASPARPVRRGA
jgi:hypothetical protein